MWPEIQISIYFCLFSYLRGKLYHPFYQISELVIKKHTDYTSFTWSFHLASSSKPKVYYRRKKSNRLSQLRSSNQEMFDDKLRDLNSKIGCFCTFLLHNICILCENRQQRFLSFLFLMVGCVWKCLKSQHISCSEVSFLLPSHSQRALMKQKAKEIFSVDSLPDSSPTRRPQRQQSARLSAHLCWQIVECCRGHK